MLADSEALGEIEALGLIDKLALGLIDRLALGDSEAEGEIDKLALGLMLALGEELVNSEYSNPSPLFHNALRWLSVKTPPLPGSLFHIATGPILPFQKSEGLAPPCPPTAKGVDVSFMPVVCVHGSQLPLFTLMYSLSFTASCDPITRYHCPVSATPAFVA